MGRLYLGIDPGTRETGVVVLDARGKTRIASAIHIRDSKKINRLMAVRDGTAKLLDGLQIHSAALEEPYIGAHPQVGITLYVVQGVLLSLLNGLGVQEIWPTKPFELKGFIGNARAQKSHVGVAVYKRWGFDHPSSDVTDAYVLAHMARAIAMGPSAGGYGESELEIANGVAEHGLHVSRAKT